MTTFCMTFRSAHELGWVKLSDEALGERGAARPLGKDVWEMPDGRLYVAPRGKMPMQARLASQQPAQDG